MFRPWYGARPDRVDDGNGGGSSQHQQQSMHEARLCIPFHRCPASTGTAECVCIATHRSFTLHGCCGLWRQYDVVVKDGDDNNDDNLQVSRRTRQNKRPAAQAARQSKRRRGGTANTPASPIAVESDVYVEGVRHRIVRTHPNGYWVCCYRGEEVAKTEKFARPEQVWPL